MTAEGKRPILNDGWWLRRNEQNHGPYDAQTILNALKDGKLVSSDFVWLPGRDEWRNPKDLASLVSQFAESPQADSMPSRPVGVDRSEQRQIGEVAEVTNRSESGVRLPEEPKPTTVRNILREQNHQPTMKKTEPAGADLHKAGDAEPNLQTGGIAPTPKISIIRSENDYSHRNRNLRQWAFIPAGIQHEYDGQKYKNAYDALKELCLPEKWQIGVGRENRKWPLLQNYLYYTFERLRSEKEDKVFYKEQDGRKWAVFNTGLVDRVYNPIYMLFQQNPKFNENDVFPPWVLWNICIRAQKREGQRLVDLFSPCPPAARYFENSSDLIIPPGVIPEFDEEHVIYDAIEDDRYPPDFLFRFKPQKFEWEDYTQFTDTQKKKDFLRRLRNLLQHDKESNPMRVAIFHRVKDAADLASKRTFWNYKTAIPAYYPARDQLNLLLPLCLDDRDDTKVTIAMVVSKTRSGSYTAWTVFPLQWAYERARVVCRPDSDWLVPEKIDLRERISSSEGQISTE